VGKWTFSIDSFNEFLDSLGMTLDQLDSESIASLEGLKGVSFVLNENYTCELTADGVTEIGTWEYAGAGVNIVSNGEEMYLVYTSEGMLSMNDNGFYLYFER
jgi:hypothetical protein